jgi:DNA/RNA endonuclease G (NUC1)
MRELKTIPKRTHAEDTVDYSSPFRDVAKLAPGRSLEQRTRADLNARFDYDFSQVRIHDDDVAARSAAELRARAYTVESDIFFGAGQYEPHTRSGQALLRHELIHVMHQQLDPSVRGRVQLQPLSKEDEEEERALQALKSGQGTIILSTQTKSAIGIPGAENLAGLDLMGTKKVPQTSTSAPPSQGLQLLGGPTQAGQSTSQSSTLRNAPKQTNVAQSSSQTPTQTGQALTASAGNDANALADAMRDVASIRPSENASGLYTMSLQGKTTTLTQQQLDSLYTQLNKLFADKVSKIKSQADMALATYESQESTNKSYPVTSRAVKSVAFVKTLGGFNWNPGPEVRIYVVNARTKADEVLKALSGKQFTNSAILLSEAEASSKKASRVATEYKEGIISAGEATITALEITRDASFVTLGILATIASGGVAAGTLGATSSAFGLEVGTTAAASALSTGAPIVANLGVAGIRAASGEKVDWTKVLVDVGVDLILAKVGGHLGEGIFNRIAGDPAVRSLGRTAVSRIVASVLTHEASQFLTASANDVYAKLRGKQVTWTEFGDELLARLTDPKGIVISSVMGAVVAHADVKLSGAGSRSTLEVTQRTSPPPVSATGTTTKIEEGVQAPRTITREEQLQGIPEEKLQSPSEKTPALGGTAAEKGAGAPKGITREEQLAGIPEEKLQTTPEKTGFGEPSEEKGGTEARSGMHFHEYNVAEVANTLRIDYDPKAGRPRAVEFTVMPPPKGKQVSSRRFKIDTTVEGAQPNDESFKNQGYDKGHLMAREVVKGDTEAERAADLTTNVVPMTKSLNQSIWRAAEVRTNQLAKRHGSVRVRTEPIYDANPQRLPDGTPIPKAIRRTVVAPDGTVLEDASYLNR